MPYADNSLKDENSSFSEHESKVHSFQKLKDTKSQLIQAITFKNPGDIKVHFKHTLRSPGFSYYPRRSENPSDLRVYFNHTLRSPGFSYPRRS